MRRHDLQGIDLNVPAADAFRFIADPGQLPRWTHAFASVDGARAVLRTPAGESRIGLDVRADAATGVIDWRMTFEDGSVGIAHSRVVPLGEGHSAYVFVLSPPPVPLEALEGALESQARTLRDELGTLKRILEHA